MGAEQYAKIYIYCDYFDRNCDYDTSYNFRGYGYFEFIITEINIFLNDDDDFARTCT